VSRKRASGRLGRPAKKALRRSRRGRRILRERWWRRWEQEFERRYVLPVVDLFFTEGPLGRWLRAAKHAAVYGVRSC
jgi:hypothetical protein